MQPRSLVPRKGAWEQMGRPKVPSSTALVVSDSHLGRKVEQKVIHSFMGELGRKGRCDREVQW